MLTDDEEEDEEERFLSLLRDLDLRGLCSCIGAHGESERALALAKWAAHHWLPTSVWGTGLPADP